MNEEKWQVAAESREFTRGNKPEQPEPHRHAAIVGDDGLRRSLTAMATHYDPRDNDPATVEETKLYRMMLRNGATETLTRAVHGGQHQTQSYFVGDPGARSDISGLRAITRLQDMIVRAAPIVYIFGEPGSGKTNFSLLLGQLWKREYEDAEIATNIRTLEQSDRWIPSYGGLVEWLGENVESIEGGGETRAEDANPRLFIFDEASSHASGRGKAGAEAGEKLGPLVYKIRKANAGLIIIGHDGRDVHPAVRTLATVIQRYRGEVKRATVYEDVKNREGRGKIMDLAGIPQTDWNYDDGEATSWSWGSTQEETVTMTQAEAMQEAEDLASEMNTEQVRRFAAALTIQDNGLTQDDIGEVIGKVHRGEPYSQRWVSKWKREYEDDD